MKRFTALLMLPVLPVLLTACQSGFGVQKVYSDVMVKPLPGRDSAFGPKCQTIEVLNHHDTGTSTRKISLIGRASASQETSAKTSWVIGQSVTRAGGWFTVTVNCYDANMKQTGTWTGSLNPSSYETGNPSQPRRSVIYVTSNFKSDYADGSQQPRKGDGPIAYSDAPLLNGQDPTAQP
ncbi:hypothetical protein [Deinococcus sp. Marseille-Q6407]|uniref:hypothetical protein n=1 Tax=Deinococcus sp. Marseille-Q6407 TaxID=2969223 RepID=UPI0021C1B07B|nr:hypothetical protein [Deinococcus sp. Marseille-Q6407]